MSGLAACLHEHARTRTHTHRQTWIEAVRSSRLESKLQSLYLQDASNFFSNCTAIILSTEWSVLRGRGYFSPKRWTQSKLSASQKRPPNTLLLQSSPQFTDIWYASPSERGILDDTCAKFSIPDASEVLKRRAEGDAKRGLRSKQIRASLKKRHL